MVESGFIISIAGFVIICMLGIIGFFIQRLVRVVDNLESAVNELRVVVGIQKSKIDDFNKSCGIKHGVLEKRLKDHSTRIGTNERNISVLKSMGQ